VLAVDIDQQALVACQSNMEMNAITNEQIQVSLPEAMAADRVDLLMANILSGPLVELCSRFADLVKADGKIVLSGILTSQLPDIKSAYSEFFELSPERVDGEWVCIGGSRR
jgi:ribosomal protein L11 methyltransferase